MKTAIRIVIITAISVLTTTKSIAQVCSKRLPIPDKRFLENTLNSDKLEIEYFQKYFGQISPPNFLKNFSETKSCKAEYHFKNGITYQQDKCSESEIAVTITFPGYCKSELVKYVEWFLKTQWNVWNEEKTLYRPIENGSAGCYIEIKQNTKDFQIQYICAE